MFIFTTFPAVLAHADPEGWSCYSSWYGTNDGCDCGCAKLDPDCSNAKSDTCDYVWNCGSPEQIIRSQNWRCDGQPLSTPWPNAGTAQIPNAWTGTPAEFLDNVCSCGLGAFDPACQSPEFWPCETTACLNTNGQASVTSPNPWNNWKCDGWVSTPWFYGTSDGCDCGYGDPDPDCPNAAASSCEYYNLACDSPIASDANWICGGALDRAALVPSGSYCADTVNWDPGYIRLEELFLTRVNQFRAEGASCGNEGYFPPTQPLKMHPNLRCAARKYSKGPFGGTSCSHTGPSGDQPWDRATLAGYDAQCLGENMLCGTPVNVWSADAWMASDGHCAVLMRNGMNEVGIGISTYAVLMTGYR